MATSNYQNHFLQRGRFNAGSAPSLKKKSANSSAMALTAARLAPAALPYVKKAYDALALYKAQNYLDEVVPTQYVDPLTGRITTVETPYKLHGLNPATDTLSKSPTQRAQEALWGKEEDVYNKMVMDSEGNIVPDTPRTTALMEGINNTPYEPHAGGTEILQSPSDIEWSDIPQEIPTSQIALPVNTDWGTAEIGNVPAEFGYDQYFAGIPDVSGWNPSSISDYAQGPSDIEWANSYSGTPETVTRGLGDWGSDAVLDSGSGVEWFDAGAGGDYSAGLGGWSSGGVDASQAASWDAAAGEWVGPGAGTDGFGGGFTDGWGSGAGAGIFSVGSDLLSGRDINVGKAAGAWGGSALGTAVLTPWLGPVAPFVGGAVGSLFGDVVGDIGGGSILCGEWVKQGTFDKKTYNKLWKFVTKYYSPTMIRGYHVWATPIVNKMQAGSKIADYFTKKIFGAYVDEMLYVAGVTEKGNLFGKFLKVTCEPITWLIGKLSKHDPVNSRWDRRNDNKLSRKEAK